MKRTVYLALTIVFLCFFSEIRAQEQAHRFEERIQQFESEDKVNGYDPNVIFFTGSSSIVIWKSLAADMDPLPVINRGFGGSIIPEVLYFADRYLLPHKPEIIVLYSGDNDLANEHTKAEDVLQSFKDLDTYLKMNLPETKLFFISIKPSEARKAYWLEMSMANQLLNNYMAKDPRLTFIDVAPAMLDEDGNIMNDIFRADKLHLNEKGYVIWKAVIKPYLLEAYK